MVAWVLNANYGVQIADLGPYLGSAWPPTYPPITGAWPADAGEVDYLVFDSVANDYTTMFAPSAPQADSFTYTNSDGTYGFGAFVDPSIPSNAHIYVAWYDVSYSSSPATPSVSPESLMTVSYSAAGLLPALPSRPANDNVADAQVITGTAGSVPYNNAGATSEVGDTGINTVWFKWTAPAAANSGWWSLFASGTDDPVAYPAAVALANVYTDLGGGSYTALPTAQMAQVYDATGYRRTLFNPTPGTTYLIRLAFSDATAPAQWAQGTLAWDEWAWSTWSDGGIVNSFPLGRRLTRYIWWTAEYPNAATWNGTKFVETTGGQAASISTAEAAHIYLTEGRQNQAHWDLSGGLTNFPVDSPGAVPPNTGFGGWNPTLQPLQTVVTLAPLEETIVAGDGSIMISGQTYPLYVATLAQNDAAFFDVGYYAEHYNAVPPPPGLPVTPAGNATHFEFEAGAASIDTCTLQVSNSTYSISSNTAAPPVDYELRHFPTTNRSATPSTGGLRDNSSARINVDNGLASSEYAPITGLTDRAFDWSMIPVADLASHELLHTYTTPAGNGVNITPADSYVDIDVTAKLDSDNILAISSNSALYRDETLTALLGWRTIGPFGTASHQANIKTRVAAVLQRPLVRWLVPGATAYAMPTPSVGAKQLDVAPQFYGYGPSTTIAAGRNFTNSANWDSG